MRTFSFLAIALSIANSQFLGFDAVENISCKTDGTTLKTAIAVLTPNPAQIGDKVNIAITAVFSQDETVDSIKLHYIIDLDTIPVSPAVKCAANTPCNVAIDYTVPKILGLVRSNSCRVRMTWKLFRWVLGRKRAQLHARSTCRSLQPQICLAAPLCRTADMSKTTANLKKQASTPTPSKIRTQTPFLSLSIAQEP